MVFNYSKFFSRLDLQGCTVSTHENPRQAFYYDTLFNIIEHDGRLAIDWDYSADLFDEQTVALWIDCYLALLRGAARDSDLAIGALPLTDEDGRADARMAEAR